MEGNKLNQKINKQLYEVNKRKEQNNMKETDCCEATRNRFGPKEKKWEDTSLPFAGEPVKYGMEYNNLLISFLLI